MGHKVSIIMPVCQSEKWLAKSIKSIQDQTYTNWELLLVDDASTDESGEICNRYIAKDDRIRVFRFERRQGVSRARNKGLEMADGNWVLFVDSDDSIKKDTLEKLMIIADQQYVDIIIYNFQKEFLEGKIEFSEVDLENGIYEREHFGIILEKLMDTSIANNIGTKLYKKSLIHSIKFDEKYSICEDIGFFLDVFQMASNIYFIDEIFYIYEMKNPDSLIKIYKKNYLNATLMLLEKVKKIYGAEFSEYAKWYYLYYMNRMRSVIQNAARIGKLGASEIQRVCLNEETEKAHEYYKIKNIKEASIKANMLNWLIWHRKYMLINIISRVKNTFVIHKQF